MDQYEAMVETMLSGGAILDRKMVYRDIRPSESSPTLEIRVSDVLATVAEAALPATLVRATAMTGMGELERGTLAAAVPDEVVHMAHWHAARFGLAGTALDPLRRTIAAAPDVVKRLIAYVEPALEQLAARDFVSESLAALMCRGNGAQPSRDRASRWADTGLRHRCRMRMPRPL